MKLSNKILLGFLGVIFLYLTAAFTEVRLTGTPNIMNDKNSVSEILNISGVRYIVLDSVDKQINVVGSDRAHLEIRSLTGDLLKKLKYKVDGETLTLSDFQLEDHQTLKISVFVPKADLKGITVTNAVAIVRDLECESLILSQSSGSIWMTNCNISKIEVNATRGYTDIASTKMDTLSAELTTSQVYLHSDVNTIKGSIKDGARLYLRDVREIQLKKDESSLLNIYH
jgi:hypothetical protein